MFEGNLLRGMKVKKKTFPNKKDSPIIGGCQKGLQTREEKRPEISGI